MVRGIPLHNLDGDGASDGDAIVFDSVAQEWKPGTAGGGGGGALPVVKALSTTLIIPGTQSTFQPVDTAGLDITLAAAAGEVIEFGAAIRIPSHANYCLFQVSSIVSGAIARSYGATSDGVQGWVHSPGRDVAIGLPLFWTVDSADLDGGLIKLRLYARTTGTSCSLVTPMWWARNLG